MKEKFWEMFVITLSFCLSLFFGMAVGVGLPVYLAATISPWFAPLILITFPAGMGLGVCIEAILDR